MLNFLNIIQIKPLFHGCEVPRSRRVAANVLSSEVRQALSTRAPRHARFDSQKNRMV